MTPPDGDLDSPRANALAGLPETYRDVLIRWERGDPDDMIASALGVPVEGVPVLVELAMRKLHRLAGQTDAGPAVFAEMSAEDGGQFVAAGDTDLQVDPLQVVVDRPG